MSPATESKDDAAGPVQLIEFHRAGDDRRAFLCEWSRLQRVYERRRAHCLSESQQQTKTTSRLCIISRSDDPWNCFGLTTRIEYCRRAFEISALHFSELHDACATGDRKRAQAILRSEQATLGQGCTLSRDSCGRVPLHHAVVREHHRVIRLLLRQPDSRLQFHVRDNRNATPVQYVLEKMHRIASKLGEAIAGRTTYIRQNGRRYRKLWRLADDMLAGMNAEFVTRLQALDFMAGGDTWDAVRAGDVERLKQIRTLYGDIRALRLDQLGTTLLHEACCGSPRYLDVVLFLVSEVQVDRQVVDQQGATALHYAAMRGWLEACVLLLDSDDDQLDGAVVDELLMGQDVRGRTPLHAALYYVGRSRHHEDDPTGDHVAESVATARYLLQRCTDALHVGDSDGFTPLHYAICAGDRALVQLMVDLGAGVLCEEPQTVPSVVNEYGIKAPWAPCGRVFSRKGKPKPRGSSSKQAADEDVSPVLPACDEALKTALTAPGESSKACERLRKVKAGLVEHPGVAIPMETLWFWIHSKPQKSAEVRLDHSTHTTESVDDETVPVEPGDLQRYGCRRFGAVCSSCAAVPGQGEGDTSPSQAEVSRVAVPALVLAIRCCRLARGHQSNRFAIVETLLQAGASADQAALGEALRTPQSLQVQKLVLAHSTSSVTCELILDHFCPEMEEIGDANGRESSLLLALEEVDHDSLLRLLPMIFWHGYFGVVRQILARAASKDAAFAELVRAVIQPVSASRRSKSSVCHRLTAGHLECLLAWIGLWPDQTRDFVGAVLVCVSAMLDSTPLLTPKNHRKTDCVLSSATEALCTHAQDELHKSATDWVSRAIEKGYTSTVQCVWRVIVSDCNLATALMKSVKWPLRSTDAGFIYTLRSLLPSLVEAALNRDSSDTAELQLPQAVLSQCLTIICTYDMIGETFARLVMSITEAHLDERAAELLLSQCVNGVPLIANIVKRDRVDIAERLWTELKIGDSMRERLWAALVKARLNSSKIEPSNAHRWQQLLFAPSTSCVSGNAVNDLVTKSLVRMVQPCTATTKALLSLVSQPQELASQLFPTIARFNAISVARLCIDAWEATDTRSTWSRIVTTRGDVDGYSPIEICELLGHHELGGLLCGLVVGADSSTPPPLWMPENHRQLGLFRTTMTLPDSQTSPLCTAVVSSSVHAKLDPSVLWKGDWHAPVAFNDVRLLQAFFLHDLPLQPSTSDPPSDDIAAITSLLDTAIQYGCDDALQWLLLTFSSTISQLPDDTSARLLHKAARHSSPLFAKLTLRLLQHPGFSPGRISGDGTDCSLLHRVACFSDSILAIEALEFLLNRDDCDVNVRDGFGSTPVMYAMASGRLETTCWLLSHCSSTRLEAEYEGQSLFYYALHLLPSFAWRWVVQALLTTTRQAAFLHCDVEDCACKGFESPSSEEGRGGEEEERSCLFCSHSVEKHVRVPYPPWFRDQYETYQAHQDTTNEEKEEEEEEEEEEAVRRQRVKMSTPLADERTLEGDRGRLRIAALLRVTQLRFQSLLTQYALSISVVKDAAGVISDEEPKGKAEEARSLSEDSAANLADTSVESSPHLVQMYSHAMEACGGVDDAFRPRILHGEGVLESSHLACCRFNLHDATSVAESRRIVLARWFQQRSAEPIFVPSDRVSTVRVAMEQWRRRDVTKMVPAASTSTSWVGELQGDRYASTQRPVAPQNGLGKQQAEESSLEERGTTSMNSCLSDRARDLIGPPRGTTSNANANANTRCLSILQLFVHHWRYAHVYQSFRQWKRLMVNAQVAHHELETLGDTWSASDRRVKLQGLMAKQRALEMEIRKQGLVQ